MYVIQLTALSGSFPSRPTLRNIGKTERIESKERGQGQRWYIHPTASGLSLSGSPVAMYLLSLQRALFRTGAGRPRSVTCESHWF